MHVHSTENSHGSEIAVFVLSQLGGENGIAMRKVGLTLLSLITVVVVGTTPAAASPYTITDVFDPTDVLITKNAGGLCTGTNGTTDTVTGSNCESLSYSHVLTGFTSSDVLQSAELTLYLADDGDSGAEKFTFDLNGTDFLSNITISGTTFGPYDVTLKVTSAGVLDVELLSHAGSFYFTKSELFGEWTSPNVPTPVSPTTVPEPGTLVLLGAAAAAAGLRKGRRRSA